MKSLEDRFEALRENPKSAARFFKIAVIVSYAMLMLGSFFIILYFTNMI